MAVGIGDKRPLSIVPKPAEATPAAPEAAAAQKAAPTAAVNTVVQQPMELVQAKPAPAAELPAPTFAVPTNVYKVKSGDTLGGITKRFDNDLQKVVADNGIKNPNAIAVGQQIKLTNTVILNVEKGDTLKGLAAQYGITEASLATANKLAVGATIAPGSQLHLPGARFYTVKAGDTLSGIAGKFGTTAQAIAKANEITNANLIKIDQKLVVVGTKVPAPTPTGPKDPTVMKDHKGAKYENVAGGVLHVNGIAPNDVKQGQAGDCYFLAAISGLAKSHPEVIEKALKANGDGTYTATFYESEWVQSSSTDPEAPWVEKFKPVTVKIDGDIPKQYGSAVYATGGTDKEMWAPLLEKAYAAWKGGYEQIGNGGWSNESLAALTGKPAEMEYIDGKHPANLGKLISDTLAKGGTICAGTKEDKAVDGTGIVGNHAYTVLGAVEKDGKSYVQLRNPWGYQEFGNDGKDDGVFLMPAAKFRQCFNDLYISKAA